MTSSRLGSCSSPRTWTATWYRAIAGGASGYLSREADRDETLDAVVAVSRGQVVIAREGQTGLAGEIRRREVVERPILTPREREVLVLDRGRADGARDRQAALGVATIRSHLQNVYEKLGVSDRADAVARGIRTGLLE